MYFSVSACNYRVFGWRFMNQCSVNLGFFFSRKYMESFVFELSEISDLIFIFNFFFFVLEYGYVLVRSEIVLSVCLLFQDFVMKLDGLSFCDGLGNFLDHHTVYDINTLVGTECPFLNVWQMILYLMVSLWYLFSNMGLII